MKTGRKPQHHAPEAPQTIRPAMPDNLSKVAEAAWNQACDDLQAQGTLAQADAKLIEVFARSYAVWRRIDSELAGETLVEGSPSNGRQSLNRLVAIHATYSDKLRALLAALGLTPKARGSKAVEGETKLTRFLLGTV